MNSIDNIMAVQKMQEYIDENLNGEITLQQLTKVSGYSSWGTEDILKVDQ